MLFKEKLDADLDWRAKLHIKKGIADITVGISFELCNPLKIFLKAYTCALWAAEVFINPKCLCNLECQAEFAIPLNNRVLKWWCHKN